MGNVTIAACIKYRSVCVRRRRNDVVMNDLKKCNLYPHGQELAQEWTSWRGRVNAGAEDVNEELEAIEERKDKLKLRKEGTSQVLSGWVCSQSGCSFRAQTKAGLVNHIRQKHSQAAQCQLQCSCCGRWVKKQGFTMHNRYCRRNRVGSTCIKWTKRVNFSSVASTAHWANVVRRKEGVCVCVCVCVKHSIYS